MRKLIAIFLLMLMLPVLALGEGFTVDGTRLLDANGEPFIMRGVNHPHCWYLGKDDVALPAIAATGCNTVRIVCGSGQQYPRDSVDRLNRVIDRCKELGMIVVLEVHDVTGSNNASDLIKTCEYWISVKDALIGNEAYVILNVANEWMGRWDSASWCAAYRLVIPRLREAGIRNTIMVDAGGWGQHAASISDRGADVLAADPLGNTVFSVHMYGTAGKDAATIERAITGAQDKGLCIIVGEFGHTHSDGDVDEQHILRYCVENGVGYLGWSWKGNSGGVEYLDIALEWDGSRLSPDWGEVLINGEYGIRRNSVPCTVFADSEAQP